MCSKVPATRLRLHASQGYIGVGASDGVVSIFRMSDMSRVSSHPAHDMPVTGLSFCPVGLPVDASESDQKCFVLSCSVDYRLASVNLNARAPILKYLLIFFLVLILAALVGCGVYVYNDSSKPIIIA